MSHIIAIVNQKGGTGKTTTVTNIGRALEASGHKVMIIDMDAQANLTYSLGISEAPNTVGDLLLGQVAIEEVLVDMKGIDVVPSDNFLAEKEFTFIKEGYAFDILKQHIFPIKDQYDVILIDCPPNVSFLTATALTASQYVLIPMLMDALSLQGLDQILFTVDEIKQSLNPELEVLGVLKVMVDKRRNLTKEANAFIKDNYDIHIFENAIRTSVKAAEAPSYGLSVLEYSPNCNTSKDYIKASKELMKILTQKLTAIQMN